MNYTNPYPIPIRYQKISALGALTKCHDYCREFAATWNGTSGAALLGQTGCGKTLAVAIAAIKASKNQNPQWAMWIRADELSRILSVRGGAEEIELLKKCRVLIIDELGYERFPELILEVLGARHDQDRPCLVTSGLTGEVLAQRYSDATVRRITEVGDGCLVDCWPSLPKTAGKKGAIVEA